MFRILLLLAAVTALYSQEAAPARPWRLVWHDEFDAPAGTAPDPAKWTFDTGKTGWGNSELENYTSDIANAYQDGQGNLIIQSVAQPDGTYTSARLKTQGLAAFGYGRIEARIRIPFGQGIWPAFWMLGNDIDTVRWPHCGEVDIMENIGREPNIIHGTIHGPGGAGVSGAYGVGGQYTLPAGRFADQFHIFAVDWLPGLVEFSVDGVTYRRATPADLPKGAAWVFDHPYFLLLNVAVGGNWPGYPDSTSQFPQQMMVDYVRVYSRAPAGPVADR